MSYLSKARVSSHRITTPVDVWHKKVFKDGERERGVVRGEGEGGVGGRGREGERGERERETDRDR